jgi:NAD dependent epimerase/dehydratase family enzyme
MGSSRVCWKAKRCAPRRWVCAPCCRAPALSWIARVADCRGWRDPGVASPGGIILPGTQYLPWIHSADEASIIMRALDDPGLRGPVNATAPEVVTNREFMHALARMLHRPVPMRVPGFVLRRFMGDAAAILTSGRRVVPRKLLDLGFQFQYPPLKQALADLVS